jgi:hypothetical protein
MASLQKAQFLYYFRAQNLASTFIFNNEESEKLSLSRYKKLRKSSFLNIIFKEVSEHYSSNASTGKLHQVKTYFF